MPVSTSLRGSFFRPATLGGLALLSLMALPFAAIGTAMAYRVAWTVLSAKSMQTWPSVPATLQRAELKAEGSRSERATASYSYSINGQQFTGKRVSLYGADNLGSFHQQVNKELQSFLSRQAPYPVHVNPKDPSESILMPVVRWEVVAFYLVFVILFGGAGWGLLISSILRWRRMRKEAALVAQYPDEPWRQRVEWTTNRINSTENSNAVFAVCVAVFCNACAWPMLFAIPEKIRDRQFLGLLLLVFPILGVGLAYWAAVSVLRALRFGGTFLELDTFPGRQGEQLRGRLYAPAALNSQGIKLVLRCERNYQSGKGGSSGTGTETLWEQGTFAEIVRGESTSGAAMINVDFLLPDSFPDSSRVGIECFAWQLAASAVLDGADFEAEFEVPVFSR